MSVKLSASFTQNQKISYYKRLIEDRAFKRPWGPTMKDFIEPSILIEQSLN